MQENCPIENWFMQLKHEWLCQFDKLTRKEAEEEIKKYVHWYNNERIQKKLDIYHLLNADLNIHNQIFLFSVYLTCSTIV